MTVTHDHLDLADITSTRLPAEQHLGAHLVPVQHKYRLGDYITEDTPLPAGVHRSHLEYRWPMLANDQLGDCVIAMMLHSIQAFYLDAGLAHPPAFSDVDAISLYSAITGYNPDDPNSDQGANENQAMGYWHAPGLRTSDGHTHTIAATVAVDVSRPDEIRRAIWEFVAMQCGFALPMSAQRQARWDVTDPSLAGDAAPGSWGGHAVPLLSYDTRQLRCVTWGTTLLLSWEFAHAYLDEGYVVVTEEMLNARGVSPAGINLTGLMGDIKAGRV